MIISTLLSGMLLFLGIAGVLGASVTILVVKDIIIRHFQAVEMNRKEMFELMLEVDQQVKKHREDQLHNLHKIFFNKNKIQSLTHLQKKFEEGWPLQGLRNIISAEGLTPHQVAFSCSEKLCDALGLFQKALTDNDLKGTLERRFKDRFDE